MISLNLPLHLVVLVLSLCASETVSTEHSLRAPTTGDLAQHKSLASRTVSSGHLFPINNTISSWTTFSGGRPGTVVPLQDSTFNPFRVLSTTRHSYARAPDGKRGMRAYYPKGSYTFKFNPKGGFSFYAKGPRERLKLEGAKEVTFGYSIYFPSGFQFNKGGKLPGICEF